MRSRPNAMPPCGGAPCLSASIRKPNRSSALARVDAERLEHAVLHLGAVDPDAAAAQLRPVQHEVVRARPRGRRLRLEQLQRLVGRRGERMVQRVPAALVVVPLDQREVGHPQRCATRPRARGRSAPPAPGAARRASAPPRRRRRRPAAAGHRARPRAPRRSPRARRRRGTWRPASATRRPPRRRPTRGRPRPGPGRTRSACPAPRATARARRR